MIRKVQDLFTRHREGILYLFFGGCSTVVSWGSYSLFVLFVKDNVSVANFVSWFLAVAFAFVTNKEWVFESKSWAGTLVRKEIGMFVSARAATGLMEIILVPALVELGLDMEIAGIRGSVSKISVSILVVVANYFISKLVIFRKKEDLQ